MNSNNSTSLELPPCPRSGFTPRRLDETDVDFYDAEGYLLVQGGVSENALLLAQAMLERWVDETVNSWVAAGLLDGAHAELGFGHRLARLWQQAGRPGYIRSPRRDLVSEEMYEFLKHPSLLDIAQDLLGTPEISVHGVFNARPKLPDQHWTDTPWHQDAQYYRDAEAGHVVSIWIPLQPVTELNSCLQVAPGLQGGPLHEDCEDATGFVGLSKEDQAGLHGISIDMQRGDALCFHQKTPHRALSNQSDSVRWSMDVRYEATDGASASGTKHGFIARSEADPASVTPYEVWLKKWEGLAAGTY